MRARTPPIEGGATPTTLEIDGTGEKRTRVCQFRAESVTPVGPGTVRGDESHPDRRRRTRRCSPPDGGRLIATTSR
jgi:hypothetical protein